MKEFGCSRFAGANKGLRFANHSTLFLAAKGDGDASTWQAGPS